MGFIIALRVFSWLIILGGIAGGSTIIIKFPTVEVEKLLKYAPGVIVESQINLPAIWVGVGLIFLGLVVGTTLLVFANMAKTLLEIKAAPKRELPT